MSRHYLKAHPLAFSFAVSMAISGILTVFVPSIRAQSITLSILPEWIAILSGTLGTFGGCLGAYGIWDLKPRFEAAGFTALAFVQMISIVNSIAALGFGSSMLGILLRGGLAVGCISRAVVIARES